MKIIQRDKIIFLFALILSLSLGTSLDAQEEAAQAEGVDSLYVNEVNMVKGELETIIVYSLTRISLTDPNVADIVSADDKKILLIAKNPGQTTLFIWDEHGKRQSVIYVYAQSLDRTHARLEQLLKLANITEAKLAVNEQEGKIVVSGNLPQDKKGNFDQIIAPFSNEVINLVAVAKVEDMVQVDMQITELKGTLTKTLGFDWTTSVKYDEKLPSPLGGLSDLFKIGDFARATALSAKISALVAEGKARILSQPRLVVISGQEASFLVGGEVPIRTTTTTTGGVIQQNIAFKPYGINMTITPTIIENKVDVVLNVNVSEVDTSTASSINESVAFTTRTASTRLNLEDGQLIILAGLIKRNHSEAVNKVPFLGDIPLIGLVFRSKSSPAELDQELVISLRPHILKSFSETEKAVTNISPKTSVIEEKESVSSPEREQAETLPEGVPVPETKLSTLSRGEKLETALIPQEMIEYVRIIQEKIAHAIEYPKEALKYGWEGTVKIGLFILKDGSLALASIKESSGYEIFDENALATARNIAPYSSFPSETSLQELNITIPIVYSLTND